MNSWLGYSVDEKRAAKQRIDGTHSMVGPLEEQTIWNFHSRLSRGTNMCRCIRLLFWKTGIIIMK